VFLNPVPGFLYRKDLFIIQIIDFLISFFLLATNSKNTGVIHKRYIKWGLVFLLFLEPIKEIVPLSLDVFFGESLPYDDI
jgi:hypothetical protein